eukprot:4008204-Prymnesium_polylepis.1
MPQNEHEAAERSRKKTVSDAERDGFERWYTRHCNEAVDTMVNAELGEFTIKANGMELVPEEFGAVGADYEEHFGPMDSTKRPQCAVVQVGRCVRPPAVA